MGGYRWVGGFIGFMVDGVVLGQDGNSFLCMVLEETPGASSWKFLADAFLMLYASFVDSAGD